MCIIRLAQPLNSPQLLPTIDRAAGPFELRNSALQHDDNAPRHQPKGVFLETFYRKGLNSIGMHAFIDDDRYLLTGLGKLNIDNFFITGGLGVDDTDERSSRLRTSLELEYLHRTDYCDTYRPGAGFRVESISHDGREPAYIPYLVLTAPNESWTMLMQIQYRIQEDNDSFVFDLSAIF